MSRVLPTHPVDVATPELRMPSTVRDLETRLSSLERQSFSAGQEVNFQKIVGVANQYSSAILSATYMPLDNGAGTQNMVITYQPSVNCWWDVVGHIGILQKMDAAWHQGYGKITLNIPDADGVQYAYAAGSQHSTGATFGSRHIARRFKLTGGTAYQVYLGLELQTGGSWTYYQSQDALWLQAKAVTR